MRIERRKSNIIPLNLRQEVKDKHGKFLELAAQLIADNTEEVNESPESRQEIQGDGNVQYSSEPNVRQRIKGNGNIQISGHDPDFERRLASLEAFLKKPACS